MEPLLYESHMHTPLCKHAAGAPGDYAAVAYDKGLRGITVTCHNPIPGGYSSNLRMAVDELPAYFDMVAAAAEEWKGRVDVRLGLETDYVPGMEKWIEELHGKAEFHYILGSVHPHIPDYKQAHYRGDWPEFQKAYFTHLAMSAESGFFDCLAHPDLIKNELPEEWQIERVLGHIELMLDRIAATGVAMELNTSGLNKRLPEMNPGTQMLRLMQERNIPVVLGADAHWPERVADGYPEALGMLTEAGYNSVSYFTARKRQEVPIPEAIASLQAAVARE